MNKYKNYEVKYAINHKKEYQNQNQHNFYVYNEIRKILLEIFEKQIFYRFPPKHYDLEALVVSRG